MKEYEELLENLEERSQSIFDNSEIDKLKGDVQKLEEETSSPDFWNNSDDPQKKMSLLGSIKNEVEIIEKLQQQVSDLKEYLSLIREESDIDEKASAEKQFKEDVKKLEKVVDEMEVTMFLNGEYDKSNAFLSIHAGQGGTEANDWAEMLMRMYLRFFERKDWHAEITHMTRGNEAGINSVTIEVSGRYAYGLLKNEHGTHRLVRISPFNAQGLRQTSFAGVEVMPEIEEDNSEIVIKPEDIEFKAVKSSGAGGQKVNKTSSAVQIKHTPTGIQVHASERKSQHQNRASAMKILRAKLYAIYREEKEKDISKIKGEHKTASWGNQVRNYVLHPYKLVKDLRTQVETNDVDRVLDGDLDQFIDEGVKIKDK